jgi:alpha-L-fucosidase
MPKPISRRRFVKSSALAAASVVAMGKSGPLWAQSQSVAARRLAAGPFKPTWESLVKGYRVPDWFRDAKFGIWAHWSAQCVPEQGDWYARKMYLQGEPAYEYHVKTYGHPSKFGFMEIDNLWKAERWEPQSLIALYKQAGARYFFSLATHHDNFDAYRSPHQPWNSVNIGPRKDIVGTWAKAARAQGLRFGVSDHSSHASRWMQPAYGYDGEGPMAGVRYDAATLTPADGKGKWWEGLNPQDLYTGPSIQIPDGIIGAQAVREWHRMNDSLSRDNPLPAQAFIDKWFLRTQSLVDQYHPDVLYFDTNELPLGQAGLDLVAHFYNAAAARNRGRAEVIVNGKHLQPEHAGAFVEDIERGIAHGIRPDAWQTDTCIGDWHYSRAIADANRYKPVSQVVQILLDVVSKNGNLMLNIPLRGDGSIDEHERAFLEGLARWMSVNGEGIFGSRPWLVHGEGPWTFDNRPPPKDYASRETRIPYTASDIRFTTRRDHLYAYLMAPPQQPEAVIASLASGSGLLGGRTVTQVTLLGHGKLLWTQTNQGLIVKLPQSLPSEHAIGLKIKGALG